ncbi:MAG: MgtC/SapB family protein [Gemmatimonadetes bacterium]|nr:MgtC/SapB family protein [Gemmatimonadota bacterium]
MEPLAAETIRDFAIALFIGALVGIEREKKKASEKDLGLGGIRTFILVAMAGAVSGWLSVRLESPWIFAAALVIVAALVLAGYILTVHEGKASPGLTTEIAALVIYLLGGTVMFGYPALAVGLAIVTSATLAFKEPLHGLVEKLGRDDIYAGLKLLIATFIVLPLLPNRTVDPLDALNPYNLWLLVILISALSLTGYVAVRMLGQTRGTALTGLFGGLVSSTAVTLAFSKRSREARDGDLGDALAAGILLAWVVMFLRVVVEVAVVNTGLLPRLIEPLAAMAAVAAVGGGFYLRRGATVASRAVRESEVPLTNPFSLTSAIKFAAFFAAVLLLVAVVKRTMSGQGMYMVAGLAGLTDLDAITLSMAGYAKAGGDPVVAVNAIIIGALTNTVVKGAMVATLGTVALRRRVTLATVVVLSVGVLVLLLA